MREASCLLSRKEYSLWHSSFFIKCLEWSRFCPINWKVRLACIVCRAFTFCRSNSKIDRLQSSKVFNSISDKWYISSSQRTVLFNYLWRSGYILHGTRHRFNGWIEYKALEKGTTSIQKSVDNIDHRTSWWTEEWWRVPNESLLSYSRFDLIRTEISFLRWQYSYSECHICSLSWLRQLSSHWLD